jgi:hypothetical protein
MTSADVLGQATERSNVEPVQAEESVGDVRVDSMDVIRPDQVLGGVEGAQCLRSQEDPWDRSRPLHDAASIERLLVPRDGIGCS